MSATPSSTWVAPAASSRVAVVRAGADAGDDGRRRRRGRTRMSLAVSPATATSRTSSMPRRSTAGQDHVRVRAAAAAHIGRAQRQVDRRRASRARSRIASAVGAGEAGRQRDPHARRHAAPRLSPRHPGSGLTLSIELAVRVSRTRRSRPARAASVAEQRPEDGDLRLAHRRDDVIGHPGAVGRRRRCRARRAPAGTRRARGRRRRPSCPAMSRQASVIVIAVTSRFASRSSPSWRSVSSAIAGEQVMPRPPGAVTAMTPGATSAAVVDRAVGGLAVDAGPAAHDRRQRAAEDRLGHVAQMVVRRLLDGEVERLVVGVGVADRQPAVRPLHHQQLHPVLGRDRSPERRATRDRRRGRPGSSGTSRRPRSTS